MLPLSAFCILALAPAWAAPEAPSTTGTLPTIGVVGLHDAQLSPEDQDRASLALAKAVEATGRFDAVPPEELARLLQGLERVVLEEGLLKGPRQNLANGRTAVGQTNWDEARSWLNNALDEFERVMPGASGIDELWEVHVLLGATWLLQDVPDEPAARLSFASAIALNPARPIDPAQYPPTVTDVFASEQAILREKLTSASFTGQGRLQVDGAERGPLPVTVEGLAPGAHYAVSRGDGKQGSARFLVPSTDPLDLVSGPPSLGRASDGAAARSAQIGALYTSLGKRAPGLDYLLMGGVEGGVLHLQLFDVARGVFSKPVDLPYADDSDDEAVAALPLLLPIVGAGGSFTATSPAPAAISISENVALAALLTQPLPPRAIPVDPPAKAKRSKLPLALGIVGGAVLVGAGVTAAVLLSGGSSEPTGTIVIEF